MKQKAPFQILISNINIPLLTKGQYYSLVPSSIWNDVIIKPHFEHLPTAPDETCALHTDMFDKIPEDVYLIGITAISTSFSPGYIGMIERQFGLIATSSATIKMKNYSSNQHGIITQFTHKMYHGPALTLSL